MIHIEGNKLKTQNLQTALSSTECTCSFCTTSHQLTVDMKSAKGKRIASQNALKTRMHTRQMRELRTAMAQQQHNLRKITEIV